MATLAPIPATETPLSNLLRGRAAFSRTSVIHNRIPVCNPIHRILPSVAKGFKSFSTPEFKPQNLGPRSLTLRVSNDGGGGFGGSGDCNSGGGGGSGNGDSGSSDDGSNWSLLSWYLSLLAKHPVITKSVTSAFLTLIGDLGCQVMIDQVPSIDLKRTSIFTLLGLVLVGPALHFWYLFLSQLVTNPGVFGAFSRLLLDQITLHPSAASFLYILQLLHFFLCELIYLNLIVTIDFQPPLICCSSFLLPFLLGHSCPELQ